MPYIDLNCDLGEGAGHDAELMPLISSVNVACGAHAGDADTMRATVELAQKHNVAIGAHPGLVDRAHFGRRELPVSAHEVHQLVLSQIRLLQIIARQCGTSVTHVKPHGALYNMAARKLELAKAVAAAVYEADPRLILFGLAGSYLIDAGQATGLPVANEVFADRTYEADGTLTPRTGPGALITDANTAVRQVREMIEKGVVQATDGTQVKIKADTVCLHGDGPNPVFYAKRLRHDLESARFEIKTFGS